MVSSWDNLTLLILATPLVRNRCFRDSEEVGICHFGLLFQRWFQSGFQRRTFRDFGGFGCQKGTQFGLPNNYSFGVLRSPAQDGSQGVPGQAPRPQIVLKWSPRGGFLGTFQSLSSNMFTVKTHVDDIILCTGRGGKPKVDSHRFRYFDSIPPGPAVSLWPS